MKRKCTFRAQLKPSLRNPMELILALVKMIEYFFVMPVWWLAKYLAGFVFPYEGDSSHTILALSLATVMIMGVFYAGIIWLK